MRSTETNTRVGTLAILLATGVSALAGCSGRDDGANRQETVASLGAEVMPFDLDATTHTFTKTDTGGLQVVVADDPTDQHQVDLIRGHLRSEQAAFAAGDYSDPARIHGMDMPGVAELSAGYARVTVVYAERPDGAELAYSTDDPALVDAIHSWFERQVTDHGAHETTG